MSTALTCIIELVLIIACVYVFDIGEDSDFAFSLCVLPLQKNCELLRNESTSDPPCLSL